ncbi:hypothetical protein SHKM778_13960 [Streptomyces sp. KM77-8]|uniref:Uncharacterized protein n=1 Tax=Streptomyces haneummycinicus TaxID=3074435 RepID=A0AAT9HCA5_9ACTN
MRVVSGPGRGVRTRPSCRGGAAGAPGRAEEADELEAAAALVGVAGAAAPGLDQAGVPYLADQGAVEEETESDLSLAVSQRVGDQLADQEFRGVDQRLQVPGQELRAGVLTGPAHTAGFAGQGPVADGLGGQALDAGHQQGDVVLAVMGVEGVEDVVADVLQGAEGP